MVMMVISASCVDIGEHSLLREFSGEEKLLKNLADLTVTEQQRALKAADRKQKAEEG